MTQTSALPVFTSQKLVIASHNEGKVREIGELIAPFKIKVISAAEAKIDEPEETGDSFAENATLKAVHSAASSGLPALADDSGLVVSSIGGSPGIYSARWAGPKKDFSVAFERIKNELGDKNAAAYFVCMLALHIDNETHLFEGRLDGTLTFPPRGKNGFGYDPIFIPNGYDITCGEMEPAEKNRISHRAVAFAKLVDFLKGLQ